MSDFQQAFSYVLTNEGGLENNAQDHGGLTKFGIAQKYHPDIDICNLTLEQAEAIYLADYWRFDAVSNQILANKLLDLSVNMSPGTAIRLVQRAVNAPQDGILGPDTLKLINAANPDKLLLEIKARACEYRARTVMRDPTQVVFLLGWLRRDVKP